MSLRPKTTGLWSIDFGGSRASGRLDTNIAGTFNEGSAGSPQSTSPQCLGPWAGPASGDLPVEPGTQPGEDAAGGPAPNRPATGYLIDPSHLSITSWTYDGDWRTIRTAICTDGSPFTVVHLPNHDCIFVDDEGLLKPLSFFFALKGYPQPIAGRGLVLGADREGETVSAKITLDELKRRILHLRLVCTDPVTFLAASTADPAPRPAPEARFMTLDQVMAWIEDLPPPPPLPSRMIH